MSQSITQFISNFGGGTRPNRFRVVGNIGGKGSGTFGKFTPFHISSASLPSAQVGNITINYRGRSVSYPGDRTYLPWSIVVLDENPNQKRSGTQNTLYGAFHSWHEAINNHANNTTTQLDPSQHFSNVWSVNQLDTNGAATIRKFDLFNCWPVAVGPIQLDMTQDNNLCYFGVTLVFSHYTFTAKN